MSVENFNFPERKQQLLNVMYEYPNMSHAQWGQILGMSKATVETHLGMMYAALGVNCELALIVKLVKAGWFDAQHVESPNHVRI